MMLLRSRLHCRCPGSRYMHREVRRTHVLRYPGCSLIVPRTAGVEDLFYVILPGGHPNWIIYSLLMIAPGMGH